MFCPKCGTQNPENGMFCRSCGTDLGNVSAALTGKSAASCGPTLSRRGRPLTYESALTKLFMGVAFVTVSIALAITSAGRGWWFWMLIPGFMFVGGGIAQLVQLRKSERGGATFVSPSQAQIDAARTPSLPPTQTPYITPSVESRYKTGDLVPPSVTENTTRHLQTDSEGETMTLPKL